MSSIVTSLQDEIAVSRSRTLNEISNISADQAAKKCDPESWSIQEVIEHLVLAERGGFDLIYTAAEQFRMGKPVWTGNSDNDGLRIEEIIEKTWKLKEKAPPSATPSGQWSLGAWASHLRNCDDLLKELNIVLDGQPLVDSPI